MRHLNDEELALAHFGEPGAPSWAEQHLEDCGDCRREIEALNVALGLAGRALEAGPEPAPDFEQRVWQRLAPRLKPARARLWPASRTAWGALAAALLLSFLVGRYAQPPAPQPTALPAPVRERILLVAIGEHLERSRMVLLELTNADPGAPADVRSERRTAQGLVDANRLYRQVAQKSGETGLASVLDDLERVLVDLAHRPDELSPPELAELQQRIAQRGLLLKVRVLDARLREGAERRTAPAAAERVS